MEEKQGSLWLVYVLGALLVGSMIWSMIFETLLPLMRAGRTLEVWLHVIAFPLVFVGLGVLIWGTVLFVRDTFGAFNDETLQQNYADIRSKRANLGQRVANARILFRAWRRGALWMLAGFAVIALVGVLTNAPKFLGLD